jgi:hypothetical protein
MLRTVLACSAVLLLYPGPSVVGAPQTPVQIEMRNVRLHADDGVVLEISHLKGVMVSRVAGRPPVFDDPGSYVLDVQTGDVSMDMPSLKNLMNRHIFGYKGSPLKDLSVEPDGTRLKLKGKLRKGLDVPFSTTASVSTTTEGQLSLHVESMKAIGVPAKGLLDLFGLKLDDIMDIKERRGVDVDENDIVITPGRVLPPPEIRGRLTRSAVQADRLVQIFGDPGSGRPARLVPVSSARNYVYFAGGSITFGKLTMRDSDLQLIDMDPRDPFEFFPARYTVQLVAGYSKNTPTGGLRTYMPDFTDVRRTGR